MSLFVTSRLRQNLRCAHMREVSALRRDLLLPDKRVLHGMVETTHPEKVGAIRFLCCSRLIVSGFPKYDGVARR